MRIVDINVASFKSLRNCQFSIPRESSIVCLVGDNGSGKTSILQLISHSLSRVGLGSQDEGDYFFNLTGEVAYSITFDFLDDFDEEGLIQIRRSAEQMSRSSLSEWDGRLTHHFQGVFHESGSEVRPLAMSGHLIDRNQAEALRQVIVGHFDTTGQLKHVYIDANRAYLNETYSRFDISSLSSEPNMAVRKAWATMRSVDLYHQWLAILAERNMAKLLNWGERERRFRNELGEIEPHFEDPLESLTVAVKSVLPHLTVVGTDRQGHNLFVESRGKRISFNQLSGGEREALFLTGQIERLSLTRGVLLIDEPELHLNPSMVRNVLSVMLDRSAEGQLWIATHSYEAIEAAGASSTFMIRRDELRDTSITRLSDQPILLALANTLGRAGFSIANKRFVLVEGGKDSLREIPRFETLIGFDAQVSFMKVGETKQDVLHRHSVLVGLSDHEPDHFHIQAIVDADYESMSQEKQVVSERVLILDLHEIENIFLEPLGLAVALEPIDNELDAEKVKALCRELIEARAGRWVWDRTQFFHNSDWRTNQWLNDTDMLRSKVRDLPWAQLQAQEESLVELARQIDNSVALQLGDSIKQFRMMKGRADYWRHCLGKELVDDLGRHFHWNDKGEVLEGLVIRTWKSGRVPEPMALIRMKAFLGVAELPG